MTPPTSSPATARDGTELWRSDGTAAGTSMVADIVPGSGSSMPASLRAAAGALFFVATDATSGREIWRAGGGSGGGGGGGAARLKDVVAGSIGSNPSDLTVAGDALN
ncbi:MAG TPA: hypothetical protein VER17_17005, partial [Tepidisphaeraceae bacterium]|nr:hypothetical protein [Tepidisphaeraceae bacterium]